MWPLFGMTKYSKASIDSFLYLMSIHQMRDESKFMDIKLRAHKIAMIMNVLHSKKQKNRLNQNISNVYRFRSHLEVTAN